MSWQCILALVVFGSMRLQCRKHRAILNVTGGVSQNKTFVKYLKQMLEGSIILVLPESPYFESFGAALIASGIDGDPLTVPRHMLINKMGVDFNTLSPLSDANNLLNIALCLSQVFQPLIINPFHLQYPINPLGNSVFQRVSIFGHTDLDAALVQYFDVLIAAILNASIRMMNQLVCCTLKPSDSHS